MYLEKKSAPPWEGESWARPPDWNPSPWWLSRPARAWWIGTSPPDSSAGVSQCHPRGVGSNPTGAHPAALLCAKRTSDHPSPRRSAHRLLPGRRSETLVITEVLRITPAQGGEGSRRFQTGEPLLGVGPFTPQRARCEHLPNNYLGESKRAGARCQAISRVLSDRNRNVLILASLEMSAATGDSRSPEQVRRGRRERWRSRRRRRCPSPSANGRRRSVSAEASMSRSASFSLAWAGPKSANGRPGGSGGGPVPAGSWRSGLPRR
jgi:hypothetical protein